MSNKTLKTRIKLKRDTSANWEKTNPVLLNGEIIIVDTANNETRTKTGDGTKTYTQLPFDDEGTKGGKGLSANDYTSEEKAEVAKIKDKVDKVTGKGLSANDYTAAEKAEVAKIKDKVDKVSGKGLSTNDFTSAYKTKLDNLDTNLNAKANASAVLTKTNTTAFTPTGDYQPATKKYVDDKVVGPTSVSVPTASWSAQADSSGSSYYYKKITVSGTKSTGQPLVDVVLPSNSVSEAMKALEAYRCVDKIVVGDNYIELYCFEVVPTSAFTLTVMIFG